MLHSNPDLFELGRLTEKHREVLDRLALHMTTKEVARELNIAPNTVEMRLNAAKKILGTHARSETLVEYRRLVSICEKTTCEDFQLTERKPALDRRPRNEDPAVFTVADAGIARPAPWEVQSLVPGVLEGEHGSFARIVYIVGAALLMLIVVLVGLSVASTLNGLF